MGRKTNWSEPVDQDSGPRAAAAANLTRREVLLAGTITEEIIFDDVSTGAQNDLERASEIARSMVMDYGMSRLGRVNYRESSRSAFLAGSDGSREQKRSTAPGARLCTSTSARAINRSHASRSRSSLRSSTTLRLPRLSQAK